MPDNAHHYGFSACDSRVHSHLRSGGSISAGSAGMNSSSPRSYDAVIAGGGIVGAACGFACAKAGLRVALVERDVLGGGATGAGMGHIVVMDDSEAQFELTRRSQLLWHALSASLPRGAE